MSCRKLSTSLRRVSDCLASSLVAASIWPAAWPVSPAAWVTPVMLDETSWVPAAGGAVCLGRRACCVARRGPGVGERVGALGGVVEIGVPWTGGRSVERETAALHVTTPQDEHQKLPPMDNLAQDHIAQVLID